MRAKGFNTVRVYNHQLQLCVIPLGRGGGWHLRPDMFKINPQFLQQWRFAIIPLCPKRSQPSRAQPARITHPPTHPSSRGPEPGIPAAATADGICGGGIGGAAEAAVGCLGGGCVAGDGVGGWVELEVLGRALGGVGLLLGVVIGHCGQLI